jgi:hypothetical protein
MARRNESGSICAAALVAAVIALATPAHADPFDCQRTMSKALQKYQLKYMKVQVKCLKLENRGVFAGPCPDVDSSAKIDEAAAKATAKIAGDCTPADLLALGFPTDCAYKASPAGAEAACAALPVLNGLDIDPTLLAQCLECWKTAELAEYMAILYPSHALGICAGTTSAQSSVCSDLECTTPLPDQRDLPDAEGDCQHGIGKAGFKYLYKRERALEKCALSSTRATCLADPTIQSILGKVEQSKFAKITSSCGSRDPAPSPPFCCKTGMANECTAAASRDDCVMNLGGEVQEDKTCGMGGTCDPTPGNKKITWWANCPESNMCPGTPLSTTNDLIDCVDVSADAAIDQLMCLVFRGNGGADWPCPASE